jgi:CRISPR/Cas system-associated exonuclease Cas4 (RecB family)
MVVGVNKERSAVSEFEALIHRSLNWSDIDVFYMSAITDEVPSKQNVIKAVNQLGIDSVLVTSLVATQKESVTTEKRSETIFEQPVPEDLSNALVINYKHTALELTTDTKATVLLSSDLFTTKQSIDNRIWGMQFVVKDKQSQTVILEEAVDTIVAKMKTDGLIQ